VNFQPELAAKVMAGEKTVTRRLVSNNPRSPWWRARCALVVGRDYSVCPGRGKNAVCRVIVTDVRCERLGHLNCGEARREGFRGPYDFEEVFTEINGVYDPDTLVWRVEFTREGTV